MYKLIMDYDKYIRLSAKSGVFLFDKNCPLCNKAVQFASKLLRHQKINSLQFPLQAILNRDIHEKDNFVFIYQQIIYESSEAWLKIFSLSAWPWSWARYVGKTPGGRKVVTKLYNFISHNRKRFFGRNCDC